MHARESAIATPLTRPARTRLAFAAGLVLTLTACGSDSGDNGDGGDSGSDGGSVELTFVNYGGDGMKAAKAGWLEPYTKKTGVTFKTDEPSDQAKIKAMVQSGRTTWDVVDTPTELTAEEAELLGRLAELRGHEIAPPEHGLMSKLRSAFK